MTPPQSIQQAALRICAAILTVSILLGSARAQTPDKTLRVMTYNLKYASVTPPNAWPQRRPSMQKLIQTTNPDLFGTQEGLHAQLQELASDLPGYKWIGTGRDGGNKGEFMAIYYRASRLQPLSTNHFWLSDTPEVPASTTWGNSNRRMVTWVRFHDTVTGKDFYHFNTHFDHEIQVAREKSAELVRNRMETLKPELPIILTGDFNAGYENKSHEILTRGGFLTDSWDKAREVIGRGMGTFNGFKEMPKDGDRIDWILTRGKFQVDKTEIGTFSQDGKFPSDHFPLTVWLQFQD